MKFPRETNHCATHWVPFSFTDSLESIVYFLSFKNLVKGDLVILAQDYEFNQEAIWIWDGKSLSGLDTMYSDAGAVPFYFCSIENGVALDYWTTFTIQDLSDLDKDGYYFLENFGIHWFKNLVWFDQRKVMDQTIHNLAWSNIEGYGFCINTWFFWLNQHYIIIWGQYTQNKNGFIDAQTLNKETKSFRKALSKFKPFNLEKDYPNILFLTD